MTPRPYLSWTQLDLIERSEKRYIEIYLNDGSIPINRGMAFGRDMADALELEEFTGDPLMDYVMSKIPKVGKPEEKITATLNGVPLLGKLDDCNVKTYLEYNEIKTGLHKWTQKKADNHGQLDFYDTLIYGKHKIKPENVKRNLVYIETKYDEEGDIILTGEVKIFPVYKTMTDVLKMSARQKKAWERINQLTIEHLS